MSFHTITCRFCTGAECPYCSGSGLIHYEKRFANMEAIPEGFEHMNQRNNDATATVPDAAETYSIHVTWVKGRIGAQANGKGTIRAIPGGYRFRGDFITGGETVYEESSALNLRRRLLGAGWIPSGTDCFQVQL